jgi:cytochrome c biogenesis protein CcmG, thiol:disulfide interchange protein DsbE
MSPRVAIPAGLLAGVVVAVALLGGVLAFAPEPVPDATPIPSVAIATPMPEPTPVGSLGPSPSTSGAPSGSAAGGLFGVGAPAPPLVVPQVGGGTIDLANLRGQPVWVNFMGTYCPPCVDEFPLMNGFAARYADDGLVILAIDVREEEGVVAAFAESLGAIFPLGLDLDGSAADEWRAAAALPMHFWIDSEGIVRDGALGGIGPDIMARGVQAIMPEVDVTVDP